jgi:hypothetical protein
MFRWETDKVGPSLGTLQIFFSVHLSSSHYTKVKARTAATMAEFAMALGSGCPTGSKTLSIASQEMLGEQAKGMSLFWDQIEVSNISLSF